MTKSNESSEHIEEEDIYSVESILKKRIVHNKAEYYIKWVGYDDCTWESEKNILDKEMIEAFEKENVKKKPSVKRKSEDKKIVKRKSEDKNKVSEVKPVVDTDIDTKIPKDNLKEEDTEKNKSENDNKKKQSKKASIDNKESKTVINTKKTIIVDENIIAVEEVYKDKLEESITAKVRYKNGSYAILPMDVIHTMAPLPLIYYYESKMVFSESKDE